MDTKKHLCNKCVHEFPTCTQTFILFGDGKGNDNVIACSSYEIKKDSK